MWPSRSWIVTPAAACNSRFENRTLPGEMNSGWARSNSASKIFASRTVSLDTRSREIVRTGVARQRTSVARREIFQQFDTRPGCRSQCCNAQSRTKHVVEMLLLGAVVFTFADDRQAQQIAVKAQARVGICVRQLPCDRCREIIDPTVDAIWSLPSPPGIAELRADGRRDL